MLNTHWKDWCWSWSSNTLATWCKQPTNWKRPWCWERLKAEEEDNRGWDGWMASPIQWTWTLANSGRWWGTGKCAVLQSMGSRRFGHDLVTEQQVLVLLCTPHIADGTAYTRYLNTSYINIKQIIKFHISDTTMLAKYCQTQESYTVLK